MPRPGTVKLPGVEITKSRGGEPVQFLAWHTKTTSTILEKGAASSSAEEIGGSKIEKSCAGEITISGSGGITKFCAGIRPATISSLEHISCIESHTMGDSTSFIAANTTIGTKTTTATKSSIIAFLRIIYASFYKNFSAHAKSPRATPDVLSTKTL